MAGIWAEVLGVERVGINESFFDLGGHSLSATQVMSRVRDAFNVQLPLRFIFENPTVANLARHAQAALLSERNPQIPDINPVPRDGKLPLSFAQERLWFIDQLEPGNPAYNIPAIVQLFGVLNVRALEQTLREVVRRHEVLRTTFSVVDGQPVQIISSRQNLTLPVVDLREIPMAVRKAEAKRIASQEARLSFNLAQGPLLRVSLLQIDDQEFQLLFTIHHIVSDEWSTGVIIREVAALYEAFAADRPSPLLDLPVQYADFACWQRGWLSGEALDAQLAYWRRQLRDMPPVLELPTDRPRPAVQSYRGAQHLFHISPALVNGLKALSRRQGVTLYMTVLAAFKALLTTTPGKKILRSVHL